MLDTAPRNSAPSLGKILIVEDEQDIRDLMFIYLKNQGFQVKAVEDGEQALSEIEKDKNINLFILDWMLPGKNGIELCRLIRKNPQTKNTAVLMVTALTQAENIISGLDAGADDYITKPFDLKILAARVRAQLRRNVIENKPIREVVFKNLKIDFDKCQVTENNENIQLTTTEYKILTQLASLPGHVFTREKLISQIQGENVHVTNRTIDTHMAGLRKKLGESADLIETIRGIGYRLVENEN
ncbi:MAG: response regulator transcription factor [Bacteriovoracaceae bacterium]|nr:response regulator transcription factor [Bacteriovoracaceae bacterium]